MTAPWLLTYLQFLVLEPREAQMHPCLFLDSTTYKPSVLGTSFSFTYTAPVARVTLLKPLSKWTSL